MSYQTYDQTGDNAQMKDAPYILLMVLFFSFALLGGAFVIWSKAQTRHSDVPFSVVIILLIIGLVAALIASRSDRFG